MDFEPSDDQRILCDQARSFFAREFPLSKLRACERDGIASFLPVHRAMGGLGWLGLGIDAEAGGSGGSWLDLALLMEEAGRALLPTVQITCVALAGRAVGRLTPGAARDERLAGIMVGDLVVTPATIEGDVAGREQLPQTRVVSSGRGFELSGAKRYIEHLDMASELLVTATDEAGRLCLVLVPRDAKGITTEVARLTSHDVVHHVGFDRVEIGAEHVAACDQADWLRLVDEAKILAAAWAIGAATGALEMAVAYAKVRTQFGRPVGSFQAVQHRLADVAMMLEPAQAMVRYSAWRRDSGAPWSREAAMAKLTAGKAMRQVTHAASLTHGGYGFMEEFDIQLFVRRARQIEHLLENPVQQREIIAGEDVEDLLRV